MSETIDPAVGYLAINVSWDDFDEIVKGMRHDQNAKRWHEHLVQYLTEDEAQLANRFYHLGKPIRLVPTNEPETHRMFVELD
jgi:hypothetical protein